MEAISRPCIEVWYAGEGVTKDKHLTPRTGLRGVQGAFCGASFKPVYRLGDCDSTDGVEGYGGSVVEVP